MLALAMAGVMAVPLLEAFLRKFFATGLPGANSLTQHFTLLVSVFGATVAAREGRLLTITRGFGQLRSPWGAVCEIIRAGTAAGVAVLLAWAGVEFLLSQATTVDPFGTVGEKLAALKGFFFDPTAASPRVAIGIPLSVPLLVMIIGLAVVAARLLRGAGTAWWHKLGAGLLGGAITAVVLFAEPEPFNYLAVLLGVLLTSIVLGAPVFTLLGGAALFLIWNNWDPVSVVASEHYKLTTNPTIPALPLFTLAGYFLAEGDTSQRLVRLLRSLVGDLRAGPAVVTVLACAFFSSLTGASGVTILALGGLLLPFLMHARYSERASVGLLTGADSIGLLIAPCLPLILYAIVAGVDIKAMFLGGAVPGTLLIAATAAWAAYIRPPQTNRTKRWRLDIRETGTAIWDAKWELLIPVVSLGSIFSGLATAVEAAAMTALYTLIIKLVIYRDLKAGALLRVVRECGLLIGGVLLILGVAQGFTNYLIIDQIPDRLVDLVTTHIASKLLFITLLIGLLLVVGCMMDVFSAIIVVVPLITPLGAAYGIDPLHLGILFLANLLLGFLTPPVGMNLFLSSYRFNKPMGEVLRASLPYFAVQFVAVIVISFWPGLTLTLPRWFGY